MKKSIYLFFFFSLIAFAFNSKQDLTKKSVKEPTQLNWLSNYDEAVKLAKKKKKPLLVFFTGSDWCGPCKLLHKDLFENPEFIALANKKLILYKADFPRKTKLPEEIKLKNEELKSKFQVPGYPTVLVLDAKGDVISKEIGYNKNQTSEPHLKMIKSAIEKYQ